MTPRASSPSPNLTNIRVAARIRPTTSKESHFPVAVLVDETSGEKKWPTKMIVSSSSSLNIHNPKQTFRFDAVFPESASQDAVFQEMAAPLVRAVCGGVNATLFAYGQTGTGKTHTMLGVDVWTMASMGPATKETAKKEDLSTKQREALEKSEMRGVIPRAMELLFSTLRDRQHKISVSYLEIYNEKILDLLAPSGEQKEGLDIREDKNGTFVVVDATVRRVSALSEVLDALWRGARNRAVCSTDMNEHSSRSHTIFQVLVEVRGTAKTEGTRAKLNLIDLAGSEKWRPHQLSEFSEQRIMEMTSINQSLSNLGNCVRGLLQPGRNHIPYRNSKLTRLVQDSLGGNARCGFVVTVSPSELAHEETISTLQFADRAKRVQVKADVNVIPDTTDVALKKMELELHRMKSENFELKQKLEIVTTTSGGSNKCNGEVLKRNNLPSIDIHYIEEVEANENVSSNLKTGNYQVGTLLQKCLDLDSSELLQPKTFLQDYHAHLRARKSDSLTPAERLALVEWSIALQAENLENVLKQYQILTEQSEQELILKDAQISVLSRQFGEVKHSLDEALRANHAKERDLGLLKDDLDKNRTEVRVLKEMLASATVPNSSHLQSVLKPHNGRVVSSDEQRRYHAAPPATPTQSSTSSMKSVRIATPQAPPGPPPPIVSSTPPTSSQYGDRLQQRFTPSRIASGQHNNNSSINGSLMFNSSRVSQSNIQIWDRFVDAKSGRAYYHCKETGQTTWKRPDTPNMAVRGEPPMIAQVR